MKVVTFYFGDWYTEVYVDTWKKFICQISEEVVDIQPESLTVKMRHDILANLMDIFMFHDIEINVGVMNL